MSNASSSHDSRRPTEDEIAKRAYELYLQRGSTPGYELDDWFEAEAQLVAEANGSHAASPDVTAATDSEQDEGATNGHRATGRRSTPPAASATRREPAASPSGNAGSGNGRRAARQ